MSNLHKSTKRDYLARVNDNTFPKGKAATLAKKFDFDYWDGDRKFGYGGLRYDPKYWSNVVKDFVEYYNIKPDAKILDVGCAKGYMLYDFKRQYPRLEIFGIDISKYAIENCHPEVKDFLKVGDEKSWSDNILKCLAKIESKYVMFCFDDTFSNNNGIDDDTVFQSDADKVVPFGFNT